MSSKTINIHIAGIMCIYFIGVVFPFHYVFLLGMLGLYVLYLLRWISKRSVAVPKLIVLSILFQNTFMGIGMHLFGVDGKDISLFSQVPTLFIFIAGTWLIVKHAFKKEYYLLYIYVGIIAFNCIISPNKSLTAIAYNTRNFIIFYFAYVIGKHFIDTDEKFDSFKKFFIKWAVIAGVIGIVGILTNDKLYIFMGAAEVMMVKSFNPEASIVNGILVNGLPGYFLGDFFGAYYWRLASLFLEPVNFSSFMALAVVLKATELKKGIDWVTFSFLLICNFFTFGKGGLLIDTISIFAIFVYRLFTKEMNFYKKNIYKMVKWGIIIGIAGLGVFYGIFYSYNMHFYAIKITMAALIHNPFGFGVGAVGNVNKIVTSSDSYLGAETGVLNFWCQLGIEGLLVFTVLVWNISKAGVKSYNLNKNSFTMLFSIMPIILYLVFIFQENIFTTQVITGYMFVCGYLANMYVNEIRLTSLRRENNNE